MICPKCQSNAVSVIPAEIRLYRTTSRVLSHPPLTPSPDVQVCLDCGWSAFSIPESWMAAGWLRPLRPQPVSNVTSITRNEEEIAIAS